MSTSENKTLEANNNKKQDKQSTFSKFVSFAQQPVLSFIFGGNLVYLTAEAVAVIATEKFLSPEQATNAGYFFVPAGIPLARGIISAALFSLRSAVVVSIASWFAGIILISGGFIVACGALYCNMTSGERFELLPKYRYDITLPFALGTAFGWALHYNWRLVPLLGNSRLNPTDKPHYIVPGLALLAGLAGIVSAVVNDPNKRNQKQENVTNKKLASIDERVTGAINRSMNGDEDENEETIRKRKENSGDDRRGEKTIKELEEEVVTARINAETELEDFFSGKGWINNWGMYFSRFLSGVIFGFMWGVERRLIDKIFNPLLAESAPDDVTMYDYWLYGARYNSRRRAIKQAAADAAKA